MIDTLLDAAAREISSDPRPALSVAELAHRLGRPGAAAVADLEQRLRQDARFVVLAPPAGFRIAGERGMAYATALDAAGLGCAALVAPADATVPGAPPGGVSGLLRATVREVLAAHPSFGLAAAGGRTCAALAPAVNSPGEAAQPTILPPRPPAPAPDPPISRQPSLPRPPTP